MEEHGRSFIFTKVVKKKKKRKEKKTSEHGRSPWLNGKEGAGPEETMKEACEASQGTVSI